MLQVLGMYKGHKLKIISARKLANTLFFVPFKNVNVFDYFSYCSDCGLYFPLVFRKCTNCGQFVRHSPRNRTIQIDVFEDKRIGVEVSDEELEAELRELEKLGLA